MTVPDDLVLSCERLALDQILDNFRLLDEPDDRLEYLIELGRMAEPQDVADTVGYLLSPAAGMVTGQTVFVDGGVTIS